MFLSVIIPAYNEGKRIQKTLEDVSRYLKSQQFDYEILVVNDGSEDNTAAVVREYTSSIPFLKLINLEENRGKGFAVMTGMRIAKGQYKLFMDADNSTSISNFEKFLPYFRDGYDIVISSRQKPESRLVVPQPKWRRFLGGVWRCIVKAILPLPVKDSQNGFKVFTREAANFLFAKQTIDGWAFDVEILALAQKFRFRIKEIGIQWENNEESRLTFFGMINTLSELFKIRVNLWKKRYD